MSLLTGCAVVILADFLYDGNKIHAAYFEQGYP